MLYGWGRVDIFAAVGGGTPTPTPTATPTATATPTLAPLTTASGNGHAAADANTPVGAIAKAASHAFAQALDFFPTENFW